MMICCDQLNRASGAVNTVSTPAEHHIGGVRYIDDLICRDRSTTGTLNERLYAMQDANWNITAITSSTGNVMERYEYDPYGNTTFLSPTFTTLQSSNYNWQTTYCGYRWDNDSGLYAVRFRYYSPQLGEWITRYPIDNDGGINLFQYVKSHPVDAVDPLGLRMYPITISFVEDVVTKAAALGESADIVIRRNSSGNWDLGKALKDLLNLHDWHDPTGEKGDCIKSIIVTGHGGPGKASAFNASNISPASP